MLPWVLLYGVTGFLFNHGQVMAPYEIRKLPAEPGRRIRDAFPEPHQLADTIVVRLAEEFPDRPFKILSSSKPAYTETIGFRTYSEGIRHHLVLEAENWTTEIHSTTPKPERKTPLGKLRKLDIGKVLRDTLVKTATRIYESHGQLTEQEVVHQWGPQLKFDVVADGQNRTLYYNVGNRNIWALPVEGTPGRNLWDCTSRTSSQSIRVSVPCGQSWSTSCLWSWCSGRSRAVRCGGR
jgi:hypothetical protein